MKKLITEVLFAVALTAASAAFNTNRMVIVTVDRVVPTNQPSTYKFTPSIWEIITRYHIAMSCWVFLVR